MKILITEVVINPPKGSGAEKLQKGAIASVLVGSGIASLFLTPVGGIAVGTIGVGILNLLHKFYSKFVHKKFRQVIEGENFDMTEQFLVSVVDKSLELGAAKGEEDMARIVEEDLLSKFDKIDQKYKEQIKFEEHLIDDAEGSEQAKRILKNVLNDHGMFSEETLAAAGLRTAGKAVNMMTSPADGVIDTLVAHKNIKGIRLSESQLRNVIRSVILESKGADPQAVLKVVDKYLMSSLPPELSYKSSNIEQTDEGLRVALVLAHGKLDFKSMRQRKIDQGKRGAYNSAPASKTQAVRQLTNHPKANINPNDQSTSLKMLQTMGYEALEKAKGKIESHLDCEFIANLHDVKRTGKGESHWEIYLVPNDEKVGFKLKADHNSYTLNDKGQRIGLGQGNVGIVADECDFKVSMYSTVQDIWPRLGVVVGRYDLNYHDCGDYVRFVHSAIEVRNPYRDEIIACIYFRDRANAYNATNMSYDVYVLSQDQILDGLGGKGDELSSEPSSWWSGWVGRHGTLVFNTDEIIAELRKAVKNLSKRRR